MATVHRPADPIPDHPTETPALLVDHVTKRFVVARRRPPVVAIDDVKEQIGVLHYIQNRCHK